MSLEFFDLFRKYLSEQSLKYFGELNIFSKKNVRNTFFFFLIVTLFGYASILFYHIPYCDDFARYAYNYTCGSTDDGRPISGLIERIMYLSNMVFDASPFTQLISCSILAYIATIIAKIFDIDNRHFSSSHNYFFYFFLACFIPVAVNPYILEMMMFRFDNIFMICSYFFSVLAAYISQKNDKGCLIFQILLLFYSITTYQAAITAYFIIFNILLLKETSNGTPIYDVLMKMKYWIISILVVILLYSPIFLFIERESCDLANFYLCDNNTNINIINNIYAFLKRIISQIIELKNDWINTIAGILIFLAFINLIVAKILQITKNKHIKHKIITVFMSLILFLCLLLALFGINAIVPLEYCSSFGHTNPRTLCSIGILISFILFENFKIFSEKLFLSTFYKTLLFLLSTWHIVIINVFGNIFFTQNSLENRIFFALGDDLDEIICNRKEKETYLHFNGITLTPAFNNFLNEYPFFKKFSVKDWNFKQVSQAALQCPRLYNLISDNISNNKAKNITMFYKYNSFKMPDTYKFNNKFKKRELLKNSSWYDIFLIDDNIIDIVFKNGENNAKIDYKSYKQSSMTRIN